MTEAVLVDIVRTPSGKGKPGGQLSSVHPVDLLAGTIRDLVERTGVDPALVEDVIIGALSQAGKQSINVARNDEPARAALLLFHGRTDGGLAFSGVRTSGFARP